MITTEQQPGKEAIVIPKGTRQLLEQCEQETAPYKTVIDRREYTVYPGVFSPEYFFDTVFFAAEMKRVIRNRPMSTVLEVGSGTGVISVETALHGARAVIAVDINPIAVKNTEANAQAHGVANIVRAIHSDVFDSVPMSTCFDIVFFNIPFCYVHGNKRLTPLEKSVADPEYATIKKFIREVSAYVQSGGIVCIGLSPTLCRLDIIHDELRKASFTWQASTLCRSLETGHSEPPLFSFYECTKRI